MIDRKGHEIGSKTPVPQTIELMCKTCKIEHLCVYSSVMRKCYDEIYLKVKDDIPVIARIKVDCSERR